MWPRLIRSLITALVLTLPMCVDAFCALPSTPKKARVAPWGVSMQADRRFVVRQLGRAALVAPAVLSLRHARAEGEPSDTWAVHRGLFGDDFLKKMDLTTESGLMIKNVAAGNGPPARGGDQALIQCVGYIFETGEKWMNSYLGIPSGPTMQRVGVRPEQKYMLGMSEGLVGMKKGGKRILVVPAYLGFRYTTVLSNDSKSEIVPGGSSMVIYVEVMDIEKGKGNS